MKREYRRHMLMFPISTFLGIWASSLIMGRSMDWETAIDVTAGGWLALTAARLDIYRRFGGRS